MRLKRTLWVIGAMWLVLFLLLTLMTPSHYAVYSHTLAGGTNVVSSGNVNGGPLGALLSSALAAFYFTAIISIVVVLLGSIAMGLRPFLRRVGILGPQQDTQ